MNIYYKKKRWKLYLLLTAVMIGMGSLLYTNWLTERMAREEQKKVELWAEATNRLIKDNYSSNDPEVNRIITSYYNILQLIQFHNTTIPIIVVDQDGSFALDANLKYNENRKETVLKRELEKMKKSCVPYIIDLGAGVEQFLYYRESRLLRNLRLFPVVQLIVIFLFIGVSYLAFSSSRKAEQNQVWVGMSKETAHQLGTPISSLMAWIELLKLQDIDPKLLKEFEKDTHRLEKIAERFSKIGSAPELLETNLAETVDSTVNYLKTRSSEKIIFEMNFTPEDQFIVPLNASLFSWVIENLCKNAIDAIANGGKILLELSEKEDTVYLDISDNGKGIPKAYHKTIFEPGYTTKKRGWGLGLSLARRIVETYHSGRIFIKNSEINKGTVFRIALKKRNPA